ncbi:MAG: hypothetical protein WDZ77_01720 [Candidatus Pacearchaeota archaeon]
MDKDLKSIIDEQGTEIIQPKNYRDFKIGNDYHCLSTTTFFEQMPQLQSPLKSRMFYFRPKEKKGEAIYLFEIRGNKIRSYLHLIEINRDGLGEELSGIMQEEIETFYEQPLFI